MHTTVENKNLPNLICPGAQRSGTSYMHNLLSQHKDILGATAKEVHYFDININKGPEWYKNHFNNSNTYKYRLDTTPEYMIVEEIPGDIKTLLGSDVKFIFMLRNPVTRIYSEYMSIPVHDESMTFEKYLEPRNQTDNSAPIHRGERTYYSIRRGFYARRINAFTEIFPKANMFFVIFEDFIKNPESVLLDICKFLEIEYDDSIKFEVSKNPSLVTSRKVIHKFDTRLEGFYRFLSSRISMDFKNKLKKLRNKVKGVEPREKSTIDPKLAGELLNIYRDDILELGEIIERDMTDWLNLSLDK